MPNFFFSTNASVNALDTVFQALGNNDSIYVAQNCTVASLGNTSTLGTTPGSSCISTGTGVTTTTMNIFGNLYSATADGIYVGGGSTNIRIGEAGSITGGQGFGIRLGANTAVGNSIVTNAGSIFGADGVSINGTASVTNTGQIWGTFYGVFLNSGGSLTLDNTGTISGASTGLGANGTCNATNSGVIHGDQNGVSFFGTGSSMINSGDISGVAFGGLSMEFDAKVVNTGTIAGPSGVSIFHFSSDSSVVNHGAIAATQIGVLFNGSSGTQHLTNSGSITVDGNTGFEIGVAVSGSEGPNLSSVFITNTGDISVQATGGFSIQGASGVETVTNRGTLTGDVNLNDGNDVYNGTHGSLEGTAFGGNGNDALTGGRDDDSFSGDDGDDVLVGGAGDDTVNGGLGKDTITGGKDDDLLTGGAKTDTFVYKPGFGHDTITDFAASGGNHDVLKFGHDVFVDFTDVQAHMAQVGADVVITTDSGHSIDLLGVTLASLVAADFVFAG